jgi:hypothetical protein
MKRIIIICPTRGRDDLHRMLAESFLEKPHEHSRLVFVVDEDERNRYQEVAGCEYLYRPSTGELGATAPLNWAAMQLADTADVLAMVGHDTVIRTPGWEINVQLGLQNFLMVYPDDGIQRGNLPTNIFMDARMVRALGYMAPPSIKHLFIDNFWLELGRRLNSIAFLPGVVFEHIHPIVGKRMWDETTTALNTRKAYHDGQDQFLCYMACNFDQDVALVEGALHEC